MTDLLIFAYEQTIAMLSQKYQISLTVLWKHTGIKVTKNVYNTDTVSKVER